MPSKNPLVRARALLTGAEREVKRATDGATFDLAMSEVDRSITNALAWLDEAIETQELEGSGADRLRSSDKIQGGKTDAGEWAYVGREY